MELGADGFKAHRQHDLLIFFTHSDSGTKMSPEESRQRMARQSAHVRVECMVHDEKEGHLPHDGTWSRYNLHCHCDYTIVSVNTFPASEHP